MRIQTQVVIFIAALVGFSVISLGLAPEAGAREWIVPDEAPSITAAMDSCVTGDVVVIQPGTYTDCTTYSNGAYHIAVLPAGVSVRGASGDPDDVILDAGYVGRCFEIRNNTQGSAIENITMRRGRAFTPLGKGGAVFSMFSNPTFRNCVFDSNYADFGGGGISAGYGDLTVEDCVFTGNETDGIGAAVQVSSTPTTISGSTIWGCRGPAVHYATDPLTMSNCIIADGDAEAILQNSELDPDLDLNCINIHGNETDYGEFFEENLDQDGNISADPLFCNAQFGDLTLYAVSPCAAENAGDCGQIGAFGVGCGTGASFYVLQPDGSGDFPTIQTALNAAVTGDTIALADGVFSGDGNRDLDFHGKAITLMGLNGDPEAAIIDCGGTAQEPHRAFIFQNNETPTTVLRDIGITNGNVPDDGGAILCMSGPLIQNMRFWQNHADRGGAIFCDHGDPEIRDCTIVQNEGRVRGGGVAFLASEAQVRDCLLHANWGYMGAAFFLPDSSEVTISGCTIVGNNNSVDRATIGLDGNSSLNISNCIIMDGPYHAFGEYDQGSVTISGCDVYGHGSSNYGGPVAGQNGSSGNISADPLFCDAEGGDYTLRGDSPCAQTSAPNGIRMGNQPVGCEAPSIFTDVSDHLPAATGLSAGVTLADWNNDGHLDVVFVNQDTDNEAFTGDGNWNFTEHTGDMLSWPTGAVSLGFADPDHDGDLDVYLDIEPFPSRYGTNDGNLFHLADVPDLEIEGTAASSRWGDPNGDGYPDLFIARPDSGSMLMVGQEDGSYVEGNTGDLEDIGPVLSAAFADYDNDGDQDLYLVKDGEEDQLLKRDNGWVRANEGVMKNEGAGRGAAWGDHDNDGDLDLYLAVDQGVNTLYKNGGNGTFTASTSGPLGDGGPGRSGIWGDWDNDGDLDLFLGNCGTPDRLLRNDGGNFVDTGDSTFAQPDSTEGAAFADVDGDGDLDLVCAVRGGANKLLRNDGYNENHWLKLDLRRHGGMIGSSGARVTVYTGADSLQVREVAAGGGWRSHDDLVVHFGLGSRSVVDSLVVTWPGGEPLSVTEVAADQLLVLVEAEPDTGQGVSSTPDLRPFRLDRAYPNPFNPATTIGYEIPEAGHVQLRIYDMAGRLVRTLVDEHRPVGPQRSIWRGRDNRGRTVAAGVYHLRLQSGRFLTTRSVTLIK